MPRTREQNHQKAVGVMTCICLDLAASMQMLEYLINLVPTGPDRNAITEVNIRLGQLRVELAALNVNMEINSGTK